MTWLLELALIGLLAATLFHAVRLEKALGVLKRDRSALEDLVASFNSSTQMAEQGIERLRSSADGTGRQISKQIDRASGLKDDLLFLTERGEQIADRLETTVRAARKHFPDAAGEVLKQPLSAAPAARPSFQADPAPEADAQPSTSTSGAGQAASSPAYYIEPTVDHAQPRLRSQAERDLLKALRMAR